MKLGISAYSYSGAYSENFTIEDAIKHAKKTGFDGIEFLSGTRWQDYSTKDSVKIFREMCEKEGLEIYSYDGGVNFLSDNVDEAIANGKKLIDEAEILGVPNVRCDTIGWNLQFGNGGGIKQIIETVSERVRHVADYAAEKNINLLIENHGKVLQDSIVVEELINTVNRPNYGALVDVGNFMCADESSVSGVGRLGRYAKHVHLKDFHFKSGNEVFLPSTGWFYTRGMNHLRGAILGHGAVPIYQCIKILESYGYDGVLSLEFEGIENTVFAVEESFNVMRNALKSL